MTLEATMRCPVDEIGRNSVIPSTIPSTKALSTIITATFPRCQHAPRRQRVAYKRASLNYFGTERKVDRVTVCRVRRADCALDRDRSPLTEAAESRGVGTSGLERTAAGVDGEPERLESFHPEQWLITGPNPEDRDGLATVDTNLSQRRRHAHGLAVCQVNLL